MPDSDYLHYHYDAGYDMILQNNQIYIVNQVYKTTATTVTHSIRCKKATQSRITGCLGKGQYKQELTFNLLP